MTDQEVIKWIDSKILALACKAEIVSADNKEMDRIDEDGAALLHARKAIYKQIQEKPQIKETEQPFAKFGKSGVLKRTVYSCPVCGKPLYVQNHFEYKSEDGSGFERWPAGSQTPCCPMCGQALKWKED